MLRKISQALQSQIMLICYWICALVSHQMSHCTREDCLEHKAKK